MILLLIIVTAFIGYVLPWGQISFWGATVITSLASAIPVVGNHIVTWLWGGFSVDNASQKKAIRGFFPYSRSGLLFQLFVLTPHLILC